MNFWHFLRHFSIRNERLSLIEINNLRKEFSFSYSLWGRTLPWIKKQSCIAVDDLTLKIEKNEIVALLGRNGSGKTTLLKMCATLISQTSGSITICGYDTKKDMQKVQKSIGFVFSEARSFYWRLTCRENLLYYGALYGLTPFETTNRIEKFLDIFDLGCYIDRVFGECSAGIRQRLSFVRALIHDPAVIFVDEPAYSIDLVSRDSLHRFIKEILIDKFHKTILFVTHDLLEIKALAQRIVVMENGLIKKIVSSQDVTQNDIALFFKSGEGSHI
jgi:ABC-type multidrug transport system ATPase subunit